MILKLKQSSPQLLLSLLLLLLLARFATSGPNSSQQYHTSQVQREEPSNGRPARAQRRQMLEELGSAASFPEVSLEQLSLKTEPSVVANASSVPEEPPAQDKRAFVTDLLRMLHEQYAKSTGSPAKPTTPSDGKQHDSQLAARRSSSSLELLDALGADGDVRRLLDWAQNSFNLASLGELSTQFVVSKLGSVNCAALFPTDAEESLIPRFLLFNEHFTDVPLELPLEPSPTDCLTSGKFDPQRKTALLLHGFLGGYAIVDGLSNIKNRLLDLNGRLAERALADLEALAAHLGAQAAVGANASAWSGGERLLRRQELELELRVRRQQYNVIIVDWFRAANPSPRSRYIKAAVNSQVVGRLIARFLLAMESNCGAQAARTHVIAHSLGCHVAGFTGKALQAARKPLGKITHLDPIGLCFGRLFSQPQLRLSATDALDTSAVHTSLNIFDNPLDGVRANFLVNGGRDQLGCGGQSELSNSTSSSLALLVNPSAKFTPCSHMRALALFEDDLSSQPGECQLVGYRCASYERFLAGRCGPCDARNNQCRLMSLAPLVLPGSRLQGERSPLVPPKANMTAGAALAGQLEAHAQTQADAELAELTAAQALRYLYLSERADQEEDYVPAATHGTDEDEDDDFVSTDRLDAADSWPLLGARSPRDPAVLSRHRTQDQQLARRRLFVTQAIERLRKRLSEPLVRPRDPLKGDEKDKQAWIPTVAATANDSLAAAPSQERWAKPDFLSLNSGEQKPPLGSQTLPAGASNAPLYFVGTESISPFCVNYYQVRLLLAEQRVQRLLALQAPSASSDDPLQAPQIAFQALGDLLVSGGHKQANRPPLASGEMLHVTVKLTDSEGHFFKGFTLVESARSLPVRRLELDESAGGRRTSQRMLEMTLLLNSTQTQPVRIGQATLSFYFHRLVLADAIEVNYLSNISPSVRARYSSQLCPIAINDQHQLVKYVDCDKVTEAMAQKRRR